ncbi:MAG: hypothetical protein ACRDOI_24870 [Trebonia sp.]
MKRTWLAALGLLLAGCGIAPSGVTEAGRAPTGLAPGVTLYFVDAHQQLRQQLRPTGRLGTISEAMYLLLTGPGTGDPDLHTEIAPSTTAQSLVTTTPSVIQLQVPLTIQDVTPLGLDQIVCTALGTSVQAGGSKSTKVQVVFIQATPESAKRRSCPLIS